MEEFVVELSPQEESLRQIIEPLLASEGFSLLRIRLKRSQSKSVLAIYIDTSDRVNGVVLENLTDISRLISDILDTKFGEGADFLGRYDLEVSSPGLDRPLSRRMHFTGALGERVKLKLKGQHAAGAKNIVGILREVLADCVTVEPDYLKEETVNVAFHDIADAHIVFDFSKLDKHKKHTAERACRPEAKSAG